MIRVLEKGEPPARDQEFHATCGHCGSRISFAATDAKVEGSVQEGIEITVTCPVCGKTVCHGR